MRRVVVTGLGIISPIGNDVPAYWNSLKSGVLGIDFITRFDASGYRARLAAEVKGFDPKGVIEPSEARRMDLYSQYAVCAAQEAYDDAGLSEENIAPERIGVYFGSGIGGINTYSAETEKLLTSGPKRISPFFVPMMIANMAAGLISARFNAKGPILPIVTACATGTNSIGEAFRAIRHGYADVVISGGSEAAITPAAIAGFVNCMALSTSEDRESASIPFDRRRSGFVMGEGAGCLILEEYRHAVSRGTKIYAEITGYGNTSDAYHMTAPHPEGEGAKNAMLNAIAEAGCAPEDIGYINAHGTGTPQNDKVETSAIKQAFGKHAYKLMVSSTKSMTGHMLGAAGAAEAIASVLALKHGIIPPTIGFREYDPECDLDIVPNTARAADIEYAMSNSLGFGGHNASIVLRRL
jgi:3-oxoacyl-[acyl-carrier-protein] synthase II